MKKKRAKKAFITGLSTALVAQAMLPVVSATTTNTETQSIDLEIVQKQKVDVVLTTGTTNIDVKAFESELREKLESKGIDENQINIQSLDTTVVSTNSLDAQQIFNSWINYPNNTGKWVYKPGDKALGSTQNVEWTGYWTPDKAENLDVEFDMRVSPSTDDDSIGWTFNMNQDENGNYSFYVFTLDKGGNIPGGLYKITNWNPKTTSTPIPFGTNQHQLAPINYLYSNSWKKARIVTKGNHIQIWYDNKKVLDYVDNDNPLGAGGYGPFTFSQANGQFSNIKIASEQSKDFVETLSKPVWGNNSERFVINFEDEVLKDFDSPQRSGEVLTRLMNEDIHYVGIGSDTNKEQAENLIQRNNEQGMFLNPVEQSTYVDQVVDYIATELEKNVQTVSHDHPYVLRDTPIRFNHENVSGENWTLTHDDTTFENSEGTSMLDGLPLAQLPNSLDKTGAYQLKYGEQTINPQTVFAHRLPTTIFMMQHTKHEDNTTTITATDHSYDLDHQSTEDKGIVAHKWRWKETTATEWNEGTLPPNLPEGKHYLVQLQVQDVEGAWGLPLTNYVTTDPTAETIPIANFTLPQKHDVSEELTILDHSYEPAGHALTTTDWVIYKNGEMIYTGTTPITDFTQYGVGTYAYELTVTNALGNKSETFTRQVEVHEPNYTKAKEQMELVTDGILNNTMTDENIEEILKQTEQLVNILVDTGNKSKAEQQLAELDKLLAAVEAVEKAEGVKPLSSKSKIATVKDLIATAKPLVNVLTEGEAKTSLENRLKALEAKLIDAENNLIQVEIHEDAEPSFVGLSWQPFDEFDGKGTLDYKIIVKQYDEETDTFSNNTFDRSSKTTEIDIQGLTPGTYEFSVYPRKNGVVISDEPIGIVVIEIPEPTKAAAPTVQNVVATSVDATTATITWDAFESAKRYRVQYYVQDPLTGEFVKEGYGRTTTTPSLTINTLAEGRTYKFDVTPYVTKFDDANKGDSNVITLTAPVVEEPPVVENRLHVEAINETTANLSWEQLEGEDRYRVQLFVKNSSGVFEQVGYARAIPETTFVYSDLTPGLEYKFEVVPRVGYKYDTSKAFTETIVMPSKEEPPVTTENKQLENFAVNMQGKTAELSWDALNIAGENVTAYRVHRYVKDELTGQYKWELTRTAVGTNYLDTYNLRSGKTYRYEIIPRVGFKYDESYKTTSADIVNP